MIINIDREKFISGMEEIIDEEGQYEGLYYSDIRTSIAELIDDCILSQKKSISLKFMINEIKKCANEIAIGYNDSGGFWHINYGCRGSGNHIEGCGKYVIAADEEDFYRSVKFFYKKIVEDKK